MVKASAAAAAAAIMADVQIVKQLIDRLRTEEAAEQEATAEQIK